MKYIIIFALISMILMIHPYTTYPLTLKMLRNRYGLRSEQGNQSVLPRVSILISAYNEDKMIAEKIKNLVGLDYPSDRIEILIGSDGSTDRTVDEIHEVQCNQVQVFTFDRIGKAMVLQHLVERSTGDVLVFTDAAIFLQKDSLKKLVGHFQFNPEIGCVSGNIIFRDENSQTHDGVMEKLEKRIKRLESQIGYLIGASGGLYAIKREAFVSFKPGVINDDFYISMNVISKGYRAVFDSEAIGYKYKLAKIDSEIYRYRRDSAGHYQIMKEWFAEKRIRKVLVEYLLFSHRFIRWVTPFLFIVIVICTGAISYYTYLAYIPFLVEIVMFIFLVTVVLGKVKPKFRNSVLNAGFTFLLFNVVMLIGFYDWVLNRQKGIWETIR